jgi:ATP-dependent RNA helicase DDX51/DBP6
MLAERLQCQKLLFSATLTRDPAAIASLDLNKPRYTIVTTTSGESDTTDPTLLGTQFTLPATLSENYLVVAPSDKPLNLIHLLHSSVFKLQANEGDNGILVFTKSVESVGRLVRLIHEFEGVFSGKHRVVAKGYSGEMKPGERKTLLADFAAGKVNM